VTRPSHRGAAARPDLLAGLSVLALGLLALWQAVAIPASPIYAQVGPKLVPYLIAAGLLALGAGLVVAALRGGWSADLPEVAEAPPANRRALALMAAGLLANLVLIGPLGFVPAATVQYVLVCAAFGSRRPLRDLAIGLAVTLAAFLGFARVLGVNIGAGPLLEWLL
jgi:putative tricarboxylic transport membrane protein